MAPIRCLALPGFAQSAQIMMGKLRRMREIFGDEIEIVALDPPNRIPSPTISHGVAGLAEVHESVNPVYSWWDWESSRAFKDEFELAIALAHLRDFLERNEPFDVLLGFSMGASMAVLVLALMERPYLHPIWNAAPRGSNSSWPPRPFKAAVLCSAFGPGDPECVAWFEGWAPSVPTLHVIGENDVVVSPNYSFDTAARFSYSKVVWHTGGHHVPRKAYFAHLFKQFYRARCFPSSDLSGLVVKQEDWGTPTESVASLDLAVTPLASIMEEPEV
ncbi:hypothetical protein JCM10212_002152 [Sporobolomyces blumeae]